MTPESTSTKAPFAASFVRAEKARLIHRVESLEIHRVGLDRAIEPFGGKALDPEMWRRAFASSDPEDVVARNGLTGCYSAVINGYAELLKTGTYLAGLAPHKKSRTRDAIDRMREDGGITKGQAESLHDLFVFEGRVQHASPDVDADQIREAVELLRAEAPGLIRNAVLWFDRHGLGLETEPSTQNS